MTTFAEIVDAADRLSADEQFTLLEILRRRLAERDRQQLVRDVAEARAEFASGASKPVSVKQIMDEVGERIVDETQRLATLLKDEVV